MSAPPAAGDVNKVIGPNIRRFREARGMTQQQLADAVNKEARKKGSYGPEDTGLTQRKITDIEAGKRVVSLKEAILIAGELGTTVIELAREPAQIREQLEIKAATEEQQQATKDLEDAVGTYLYALGRVARAQRAVDERSGRPSVDTSEARSPELIALQRRRIEADQQRMPTDDDLAEVLERIGLPWKPPTPASVSTPTGHRPGKKDSR